MKFREHRGDLAESMETVVEVSDRAALLAHIRKLAEPWPTFPPITDEALHIESYGFDARLGWETYIVVLDNYGVLGYTDGAMQVGESQTWQLDEHRCWNLYSGNVHVWLQPRPAYCDRGHWIGKVDGIGSIDAADAFPRYYMDLDRAKLEMSAWLEWRLQCDAKDIINGTQK